MTSESQDRIGLGARSSTSSVVEGRPRRHAGARLTSSASALLRSSQFVSRQRIVIAVLVMSLALAPIALFPRNGPIYAGIATASPTIYTYTAMVVAACAVMALAARAAFFRGLLPWAPFLVWLAVLTALGWGFTPRMSSGLLHLCLGVTAFAVGAAAARQDRDGWVIAWAFAAAAWLQLAAIAMAELGHPLRTITGPQALDIQGRATGLTSHPGELAKLLFFCGLCCLTLPQRTSRERWAAWLSLTAVLAGISLSQSRSVLVAAVAMILVSVLLELVGGRWQRRHFAIVALTLGLGALSLPWLIRRFGSDPEGGARQHLAAVAWGVIRDHFWVGVGPNNYVAVAGTRDAITATGVPVHNIFLLSAAELGIIGALLLWLPFAAVSAVAIRRVWRSRGTDQVARVVTSALPGLGLLAMTSWGLLQGPYFLVFALVFGFFGAHLADNGEQDNL
jgi:hypothetical protein